MHIVPALVVYIIMWYTMGPRELYSARKSKGITNLCKKVARR